jgi:hypothetical protein
VREVSSASWYCGDDSAVTYASSDRSRTTPKSELALRLWSKRVAAGITSPAASTANAGSTRAYGVNERVHRRATTTEQ